MRLPLLILALVFPATGFAQTICYSPSDCVAPQRCSSLLDGIVPGTCGTDTPPPAPVVEVKTAVPAPVVTQPKKVVDIPASASSASSAPSSAATGSSSVSSATAPAIDTSIFSSMMTSMLASLKGMMASMQSMLSSFKCMFGGC